MKRLAVVLIIGVLWIGFSENIIAGQKGTEVFTNLGGFIPHSGAGIFFVGANIDQNLGSSLMLTGDANVMWFLYIPVGFEYGGILNFKIKNTFFGAGISRWTPFGCGGETMLKMNIGIKMEKVRASLFIYTDLGNPFEHGNVLVGIQAGYQLK